MPSHADPSIVLKSTATSYENNARRYLLTNEVVDVSLDRRGNSSGRGAGPPCRNGVE